jgi:hypothetical protein
LVAENQWLSYSAQSPFPSHFVMSTIQDKDGNIWFQPYEGGLTKFDGASYVQYDIGQATCIAAAPNGKVYAGTKAGVSEFSNGVWSQISSAPGVVQIGADSQNNIWVATSGAGALTYNGTSWTSYTTANSGIVSDQLLSLHIDSDDNVWLGSEGGSGISQFSNGSFTTYNESNSGLLSYDITSIASSPDKSVYAIVSTKGIFKLVGNQWINTYNAGNTPLPYNSFYVMTFDTSGNLWLGSPKLDGYVYAYNGSLWRTIKDDQGLISNSVWGIGFDNQNNAWVSTTWGVSKISGDPFTDLDQTISFGSLAAKTYGDPTFELSAVASSGLPVSYLSSNPSVATVTGSSVTIVGAGTTTITASQLGNTTYKAAADVEQSLTVSKANQSIAVGIIQAKTFGDAPFTLSAAGGLSGNPVSFTSTNTSVVTISGNIATVVGAGSTNLVYNQAGNDNYNAAPTTEQELIVNKASQAITWPTLPTKTFGNSPFDIVITSKGESGLPVTFTSSNTSVATVSGNTITILGVGTTVITASQAGNSNYNAAQDVTQTFTVNKADQFITTVAIPTKQFGDPPFDIVVSGSGESGQSVLFTSSNTSVATISGKTITIVGAGTTTITASQAGNSNYNAAQDATQTFIVNKADQFITTLAIPAKQFDDPPFDIVVSESGQSGQPVLFTSSNASVATVSGKTITIVGAGTATITASQAGNSNYNAAEDVTQLLTVNKANQIITFGTIATKTFGDAPFTLTAMGGGSVSPVTFTSSNTLVATISGSTVTIVGVGTTTITASQSGNANFSDATPVTQTLTVNQVVQNITFNALPVMTFGSPPITLNGTASSGLPVTYASTNPSVATVSGSTLTIVGAGTTTITAKQSGTTSIAAAVPVARELTVNKGSQTIAFGTIATKTFGDAPFTLEATSSSGLSIVYTSSDVTKASVNESTVTLVNGGQVTITADQPGDDNFNAATSVAQTFCINPGKPTITLARPNTDSPVLTSSSATGNQWFNNGTAISGATSASYTVTEPGVYTVRAKADVCTSVESDAQALIVTGDIWNTNGSSGQETFLVYPIPAREEIKVSLAGFEPVHVVQLHVYDMQGKVIFHQQSEGEGTVSIAIGQLAAGKYVVRAEQGSKGASQPFTKE